jgi:catechol 2,3-dioxygenase-like lactoylglutathione lyase family enzyme
MLANAPVAVVFPCVDLARARQFYGQLLGLPQMDVPVPDGPDGQPAGVAYQCGGGTMIFVYVRATPTTADHTVASWMVSNFDDAVDDLISRGVTFEVYEWMPDVAWDERGVASHADGEKNAWFKDPEGNILSITNMPT